jgi:hypothetical protein
MHAGGFHVGQLVVACVSVVSMLRPASPPVFTAGDKHARSWALCLYALSVLHDPENRKGEERSNAVISRVLLEQMLPVLQHVASLEASTPAVTPVVSSGKEAAAGAAPGHGARCTTCEASAIGKETDATPGAQVPVSRIICNIPADNTLLLLKAVAYVTGRAAAFVTGHECESAGTAQGLHHAGSSEASQHCSENFAEKDVDALITALDAVLRLASALVSGGPWWQEARTKHPLVLIETLYDLRAVSGARASGLSCRHSVHRTAASQMDAL